jgi:hypothetical protein
MKLASNTMAEKEQPNVVIQTPEIVQPQPSPNKKNLYVAVAVSVVLVTIVVVTGFVLTFHFYNASTHDIIKHTLSFKDEAGKEVREDIETDMTDNVAYMRVDRGEAGIHHILHDYNRKISTIKRESREGEACYLSALNTNSTMASSVLDDKSKQEDSDSDMIYVTDPNPVSTLSFLSPKAQALCEGHPTHWSHPTCASELQEGDGRSKREVLECSSHCCLQVCCTKIKDAITWIEGETRRCQWICQRPGTIRVYGVCTPESVCPNCG